MSGWALLATAVATATTTGPTVVCLQLASRVEAPRAPLEALRRGMEAGGEPTVLGPPVDPGCAGNLACVQSVLTEQHGGEVLFVALIGLESSVQLAATRASLAEAPEDLETVFLPRNNLEGEAFRVGQGWARPRSVLPPPSRSTATSDPVMPPAETRQSDPIQLRDESIPRPVAVSGAVSAVALVAGVTMGLVSLQTRNDLRRDGCSARPCGGRVDRLDREAFAADALFVTAGVAAAAALVLWIVEAEGR